MVQEQTKIQNKSQISLPVNEKNLIAQKYLSKFHPEAIKGMNEAITIAEWMYESNKKTNSPDRNITSIKELDSNIEGFEVNNKIKPILESCIKNLHSFILKEPNETELTEHLVKVLTQFSVKVEDIITNYN